VNREDIIRFGEQADEAADRKIRMRGEYHPDWHEVRDQKFAALVAAHEREACARLCDEWSKREDDVGGFIGRAIRARGEA
jgi:hypothetical protein